MQPNVAPILAAGQITASGQSGAVDVRAFDGWGLVILNASATGAVDNTADFVLEHSSDGVTFEAFPGAQFDQVINAGPSFQLVPVQLHSLKRYARMAYVLAGTGPTVVASAEIVGRHQRRG